MKKRKAVTANPGAIKAVLDSRKNDTRLLGKVERHLMAGFADGDADRDQTRLHVSEMAKHDWCPRQSFYRLAGYPERKAKVDSFSFVLENIFDEGHEIHAKWQARIKRMGALRGKWECLHCFHTWWATSPERCPACENDSAVVYREVPIYDERHEIIGHADGDIAEGNDDITLDPLLEIKSIGIGTLRVEAPMLLADHQYEVDVGDGNKRKITDLDGVWRSLRRPLNSHIRQSNLYMALMGRRSNIFLYEAKWHQQVKEFVIRHNPAVSDPLLELALDVRYAVRKNRPPERPGFIEDPDNKTCRGCAFSVTCWSCEVEPQAGLGSSSSASEGTPSPTTMSLSSSKDGSAVRVVKRRSPDTKRS